MAGQRASHTLDPTGLANEAIMRLLKCDPETINDDDHFMKLAAEAVRQILVDHARAKATQKRGKGGSPSSLDATDAEEPSVLLMEPAQLLALNDALSEFEIEEPELASIVKMRSFAGLDCDEIGALLDTSRRTVERRWRFAMAKLRAKLDDGTECC
jgi:RNA polymerase sigma factor (TIGR02999 family)